MTSLLENEDFLKFLGSPSGRYQPIPIQGLYNTGAVRAEGCAERWRAVCRVLPMGAPLKILDIGCNLGYFGFVGAEAGHTVDGFDTNEEQIYWCNEVIKEFNIPNMRVWASSDDLLQNLRDIPDDSYDYVFYFSVHHHIYAKLGEEESNKVLWEISRIAPNMIFDMGQSNEVDNGWLTWLRKIPQFEKHREELPAWVIEATDFKYAAGIGGSKSHEIDRLLFLFIRDLPPEVDNAKKLITIRDPDSGFISRGFRVKKYIWKGRGGVGKISSSTTSFPIMDLNSTMAARFYLVTDTGGVHYFMKEYLCSWLSPNKNYDRAIKTYNRGRKVAEIEGIQHRVVAPIVMDGNIIVYPFYDWPALHTLRIEDLKHDFFDELMEVAGIIYKKIGVFDLNPNNILYNNKTGEYKLIDFEPAVSNAFTFKVFSTRIVILHNIFDRVFNYEYPYGYSEPARY